MGKNKVLQKCRSLTDVALFGYRYKKRVNRWVHGYRAYLKDNILQPPLPAVLQIIPTEKCNLRCKMCNQWGEKGYFIDGARKAEHAPEAEMSQFLNEFSRVNYDFLLSLHGGEPLSYPGLSGLLETINEKKIDTMITTNGTLMEKHAPALAKANKHILYLLSIDGDDETNDSIRGTGVSQKIRDGIEMLNEHCMKMGTGSVKIIINFCLSEHNIDAVDDIYKIGRSLKAMFVNVNFRWYLREGIGEAYDKILQQEFNIKGSGAWKGWLCESDFGGISKAIEHVYKKSRSIRGRLIPPYYKKMPSTLSEVQANEFYAGYDQNFNIGGCIMPSFHARIHSNGDLIYCPGHPDVIPGNVFREDFITIFHNELSSKFRKYVEKQLLPICNRCCGLYMTHEATRKLGAPFFVHK